MKKISMFLVASAMVMMVACNNKSAATEGETTDSTAVEAPAPAAEAAPAEGGSAFDQYLSLVNEMLPLYEKAAAGDAEANQKLTELGQKMQDLAPSLQNEAANLTPEQTQKYQEAMQKLAEAAKKAQEKK